MDFQSILKIVAIFNKHFERYKLKIEHLMQFGTVDYINRAFQRINSDSMLALMKKHSYGCVRRCKGLCKVGLGQVLCHNIVSSVVVSKLIME